MGPGGAAESAAAGCRVIGQQVAIVLGNASGPRCSIQTDQGHLLTGARVPDDYVPSDHEVVYRGRAVRFRGIDGPNGQVVFDGDGKQQKHKDANGWSFSTFQIAAVWEVREVPAPELLPPIARGTYAQHRDTLTRPVGA